MQSNEVVKDHIYKIIKNLSDDGILKRLSGNCVLASDLIQNLLHSVDVKSKIMEVQCIISTNNSVKNKATYLLGYDNKKISHDEFDTHVVVITETEPPILIDASIGHILQDNGAVIVRTLKAESDPEIICKVDDNEFNLVYKIKKNIRLPYFHQRDLLSRMKNDVKVEKELNFVNKLVISALILGATNFIMNFLIILVNFYLS